MWQLAPVLVCVCRACVHLCVRVFMCVGAVKVKVAAHAATKYAMSNGKAKPQEMQPRALATGCDFDWQRLPLDTLAKQAVVRVVGVVVVVVLVRSTSQNCVDT